MPYTTAIFTRKCAFHGNSAVQFFTRDAVTVLIFGSELFAREDVVTSWRRALGRAIRDVLRAVFDNGKCWI